MPSEEKKKVQGIKVEDADAVLPKLGALEISSSTGVNAQDVETISQSNALERQASSFL